MAREVICTDDAAKPPATYGQAIEAAGLVFVSGATPLDPASGAIIGETVREQTRQCLTNGSAILVAAGSTLAKRVSATVILGDEADFAGMDEGWVEWCPASPPARQAASLPVTIPGLKVSIACIAEA